MKRLALSAVVVLGLALPGCRSGRQAPPPAPPAPPPVVPATPPPAPPPSTPDVTPQLDEYDKLLQMSSDQIERMGLLADIHFDLDRAELREADRQTLTQNADVLKRFDFLRISVQGHCDERGSVEYNLALGERRARAAYDYLVSLGVSPDRLKTVSYGKEIPVCTDSNESCWARNRRAHFEVTGKSQGSRQR
ncbi:MAG TPA: peptidoglycan-associated lipoprotein Pal [Vicinamibacteria bacterium]|jgi:peptidoglycan-associated lipoprotein